MNRIDRLFREKDRDVLAVYFTAGFPVNENVSDAVTMLAQEGADLVEVGMPFSDPLADGPVIQESSARALANGMTLTRLFSELRDLRTRTDVPVVLMGYLNPVLQFGMTKFISECKSCGIDGVILPDLPVEEYLAYKSDFESNAVHPVFLVAPATPKQRVQMIAAESKGFVYVVSSSAVTGSGNSISSLQQLDLESVLANIEGIPAMVGFGIHDEATFRAATQHAAGGIVGTAFIRELKQHNFRAACKNLMSKVKPGVYDHTVV